VQAVAATVAALAALGTLVFLWLTVPDLWIEPGKSYEQRRLGRQSTKLLPGEGTRLTADLPSKPGEGDMHAMLGWEDSRGIQKRESGIPL
jgi:hypothetical protein